MLTIRLARTGRAKYPTYRIVAAESARAATGKFVAVLGHYNPHTKELVIKREEVQKHLSHGAQPSNTVIKLLSREKVELPTWVKLKTKEPKKSETRRGETEEATEPKTEAATAPALENALERVAEATEEQVTAVEGKQTPIDHTDTAADEEAAADAVSE